ncbi:MAG: ABC transporter permease [Acidobacteriota bacterium]
MKDLRRAWNRLLGVLPGHRRESELAAELESHIEMQTDENIRGGMSPQAARRAAILKFGALEATKESYRDQRGLPLLETAWADLRYAARGLRKSLSFTIVVVLTLAIGIGGNTAIFSLVNQLLLHPHGMDDPSRILAVRTRYGKINLEFTGASPNAVTELREAKEVFERVALMQGRDFNYAGGRLPERLQGAAVSAEWFDVFGAQPLLGRTFTPQEDQPGQNREVVLSHAAWVRLLGADPKVIGTQIQLNQTPHQIVGVMKPDFRWPQETDLWVPAGLDPRMYAATNRFNESSFAIARTGPGVSVGKANAWMAVLTDRIHKANTSDGNIARTADWHLSLVPFADDAAGDNKSAILLLLGAVGFVLLIACANIAGLMVARTSARARELAVRTALGASHTRLFGQILAESALLAIAGGLAGMALAFGSIRILLRLAPENAVAGLNADFHPYVLLFCVAATLASGVLFSLAPSWKILRINPQGGLMRESRSSTASGAKQRLRSALVVSETALALLLLVAAGLFLRSFARLQNVNPGFQPQGVMTAYFTLPASQYKTGEQQASFHRKLLENLRAMTGVTTAGVGQFIPLSGMLQSGGFDIEGNVLKPGDLGPHGDRRFITPGFLEALSVPLKQGRYFTDQDRAGTEGVVLIDENLARQYWPGQNPVGRRIRSSDGTRGTIVGVVGHVIHNNLASDSGKGVYYFSLFQSPAPDAHIVVKTSGDPQNMASVIREAMRAADPNQSVHTLRSMDEYVSRSLSTRRFGLRLVTFFAATALFLAALGLYGVINYSVAQRTREIGIRMALGAERMSVMRLVLGQGLRLAALGVLVGIGLAMLTGRFLQSQLFETSALDPVSLLGMAAVLLLAALLASYLPARRAVRVDPVITLRYE